jgi:hypothetical protein
VAREKTGIQLAGEQRRQLIAGLLARRHLVLSGPREGGKSELARALARSMTAAESGRVCALQGHPWWASQTGNVSGYASMQSAYTTWRLVYFLASAADRGEDPETIPEGTLPCGQVVCDERMGPAELDFYFGVLPYRLLRNRRGQVRPWSVRFIGTYDSDEPPDLGQRVLRVAALVHLNGIGNRSTHLTLHPSRDPGRLRQ